MQSHALILEVLRVNEKKSVRVQLEVLKEALGREPTAPEASFLKDANKQSSSVPSVCFIDCCGDDPEDLFQDNRQRIWGSIKEVLAPAYGYGEQSDRDFNLMRVRKYYKAGSPSSLCW